ncbi:MAG: ankyrin repeat domain-containing protein [Azonexus sp.]|jgi:hypothetical protein|uniref:ankyrin repeat domain-containing protein n=1 Tax=Azonexus sp. TaxID=1872668 RepID=UPI00282DAB9A|nr:ankyrin repeat domain-containing protein [Azonexus sp.]MDR0777362.1 ankyrin repeat domain-containing protein [Azonexus sp.]
MIHSVAIRNPIARVRFIRALLTACTLAIVTCGSVFGAGNTHDQLLRSLARAVVNEDSASLQRLLTPANIRRLDSAERCDLMLGLIEHKRLSGLKTAIRSGLDPNQPLRFEHEGEWTTLTPLNFALGAHDDPAVALLLIDLGADVNQQSVDDNPPLFTALAWHALPVIKRLLAAGANANARDRLNGTTPLMVAVGRKNRSDPLEIAQLLLDHGADIHAKTRTGHTALMFAAKANNQPAIDWLLKHGADASTMAANGDSLNTINNRNADYDMLRMLLGDPQPSGR